MRGPPGPVCTVAYIDRVANPDANAFARPPTSWLALSSAAPMTFTLLASAMRRLTRAPRLSQIQLLEEVIPLVIDHDEGGEILHLNTPNRLHAEFGIFDHLDLLDAVLGQIRCCAADRGKVETAVLLARLAHLRRPIALGDRHHGAARRLEGVDEGVHPSSRGRAKGSGRIALGCLRRASVVDGVVLEIIRQPTP